MIPRGTFPEESRLRWMRELGLDMRSWDVATVDGDDGLAHHFAWWFDQGATIVSRTCDLKEDPEWPDGLTKAEEVTCTTCIARMIFVA